MCMRSFLRFTALTILVFLYFPARISGEEHAQTNNLVMNSEYTETRKKAAVPFVTLRNKLPGSGNFGGQRGDLHAGICTLSFSPIRVLEDLANAAPFYIPDQKIGIDEISETSVDQLLATIASAAQIDGGSTVVYVHGYNIDFEKGCRHSAVLQRSLGLHDRLLLFSWPADGNVLKYTWDEADLVWSVPFMADFFEKLVRRLGTSKIDIIAHSLGARGVFQALTRLAYQRLEKFKIGELIFIAPDIDIDIFNHDLPLLNRLAERITIYVSENDKALKISKEVHGYPRLGEAGAALTTFDGVETVDISLISLQRLSGHVYHLSNKEVIDDLVALLHTKLPADKRPRMQKRNHDGIAYWRLMPEEIE